MGRLSTASMLTISSAISHYIFVIIPAQQNSLHDLPEWWIVVVIATLLGIILPIPVALGLNIRDYLHKPKD